jgi:small subunit ribosomal protein S6
MKKKSAGATDQRRKVNMPMYETIFILDSLLAPEEIDKIVDRLKELIETNGGKVVTIDKWGKRRLAYEIHKKQYGFYVAVEFEGEGPIPNVLEHEYNFNDKVLRYLTYRYTKNKLKARAVEIEAGKNKPDVADNAENTPNSKSSFMEPVSDKNTLPVDKEADNA